VDVTDLQSRHFRNTQTAGVGCHQDRAVFDVPDRFEEMGDLLATQLTGSVRGFFDMTMSSTAQFRFSVTV
jgi:hypothetical protein